VPDERWGVFTEREARLDRNHRRLNSSVVRASSGATVAASQLLKQPGQTIGQLRAQGIEIETDSEREAIDLTTLETAIKYEGYLRRHNRLR
jgi:tRNA U34 5-carboxymethylaminomethyl modifying enzyme MnmG/GidA